jgi:predicted phosphodiesterase
VRIAVVSDIHGNLTALEAVIADLRERGPDMILHGGDLADSGSAPAETVDRIRELGWPGVAGNTDEMLYSPDKLRDFAVESPRLQTVFGAVEDIAAATRETLGEARLAWLRSLPGVQVAGAAALVHARPGDAWRAPAPDASDAELAATFGELDRPVSVYAHIHRPFVRRVGSFVIANTGSVSLSYDGDVRASYLIIDDGVPAIRRVEYDAEKECRRMIERGIPHAEWVGRMLRSGHFEMP